MNTYPDAATFTAALQKKLNACDLTFPVQVLDSVDSTNTYAKTLAGRGERRALIVAIEQSGGRGRMGRSFYSPRASGIYLSLLDTVCAPLDRTVSITSAAAVAVMRAIRRVCNKQTEIKWVNDLYYRQKKVCGILAETVPGVDGSGEHAVIVGVGINLRHAEFPSEIADIAGSLEDETADACDLIVQIVRELAPCLQQPSGREWLSDYRRFSCVLGKEILWMQNGQTFLGRALDIDENGALIALSDDTGERVALRTGEITLRLR